MRNNQRQSHTRLHRASQVELLESRRLLSGTVATWTGAANDGQYTTAANWSTGIVPTAGEDIDFPATSTQRVVTLATAETVGNVQLDHTVLQGAALTLQGNLATDSTTESAILDPIVLAQNVTATDGFDLVLGGVISGNFGVTFTGGGQINIGNYDNTNGTVALSNGDSAIADTYSGVTTVNDGDNLYIDGTLASSVIEQANAAVLANQSIGGLTATGSEFYPFDSSTANPAAVAITNGLSLDHTSSIAVILSSTSAYGQIDVTGGTIDLGDASLDTSPTTTFTPAVGNVFTLIFNQTGSPIRRTLNGLAEGAVTTINGAYYQVSYVGGASKDNLTLTAVHPPTRITLSAAPLSPHVNGFDTLTATVTPTATNNQSPTGTVQFYQGAMPIGAPVTLVNGTASLQTAALLPGTDVINAVYSGDGNFNGSNAVTDATTINVAVKSTVTFTRAHSVSTTGRTATLSALAADTAAKGEAGLTYHWTLLTKPTGARAPILSKNDTHAARTTTAKVFKDGTYVYEVVAIDAAGDYAIADVTLTVKQKATTLNLTPKKSTVAEGRTEQFITTLRDQFGHAFRSNYAVKYSIVSGTGTVNAAGLFSAGRKKGAVVLEAKAAGFAATDGITVK